MYAVNPDIEAERQLNSWFLSNEWGAIYSPDKQYLAFNSDIDGNIEIYIGPSAGETVSNFSRHSADELAASWGAQAVPLPPDNLPIVFVHGWSGLSPGPGGLCDSPNPDAYFERMDNDLKGVYPVEYAHLETSPCGTPPIEAYVDDLKMAIELAKAATHPE